jgi:hypothetical protein
MKGSRNFMVDYWQIIIVSRGTNPRRIQSEL